MNAFQKPVGFTHDKMPLFMDASDLLNTLLEFSSDTENDQEADCQTWGNSDLVFPSKCWDSAFNLLLNYETLKTAKRTGNLHYEIEEELDGDDVNAITLKAGYLEIRQRIVFYDLPANQATA